MSTISAYTFGSIVANDRSSSSHLMVFMPRRCASGAKMFSVSVAILTRLSGRR